MRLDALIILKIHCSRPGGSEASRLGEAWRGLERLGDLDGTRGLEVLEARKGLEAWKVLQAWDGLKAWTLDRKMGRRTKEPNPGPINIHCSRPAGLNIHCSRPSRPGS